MMKFRESETVEIKKSVAQLKESLKSISAILNKHQKGILYFGIGPQGIPVENIFSEKTLRDISQSISSCIEPKIYPTIAIEKYENVEVIKVNFTGDQIPYSAEGKYYIRVADEDRQMSSVELKKFILNNKDQRWDNSLHLSATLKDIDSKKVKYFCNLSSIIDQKKFEGDLFFLMQEAEKYILQNVHIGMTVNSLYRNDVPELNQEALREAIINAFLHRDYYDPDFVSISIFKDRVEIKNPGNLFGGLTISDITSRNISKRRNEVIADILNRAHLGERKGRGIALILDKEPETKFEQIAGIFITTFKRKVDLYPQISEGLNEGIK